MIAPGAVAEVVADDHPADAVALSQRMLEGVGAQPRKNGVEVLDEGEVEPAGAQQAELLAQRREPRWRLGGREEFARQRLERKHGALEARSRRILADALHDRLVAPVHAVEAAHRERGRGLAVGMAQQAHGYSCRAKWRNRNPMAPRAAK